jgi:hypothetical protein
MHGRPHIVVHYNIAVAVKVDRIGICWGGVVCRREVGGGPGGAVGGPGRTSAKLQFRGGIGSLLAELPFMAVTFSRGRCERAVNESSKWRSHCCLESFSYRKITMNDTQREILKAETSVAVTGRQRRPKPAS